MSASLWTGGNVSFNVVPIVSSHGAPVPVTTSDIHEWQMLSTVNTPTSAGQACE